MATTMTPPAPTAGPKPTARAVRFVPVRASLLPDEVISSRRTQLVRKQVLLALVIVVGLMIAWFGMSWWQTSTSNSDLDDAQHRTVALQNQQHEFAPLVDAQAKADTIRTQLQKLMVGDLSWKAMLTTLSAKAPAGVHLTTVTGKIVTATSTKNGTSISSSVLNQTGKLSVGTLSVTGTASDKRSVAAYADRLATVKGLTAPLITNVAADNHTVTFTVDLIVTTDAFGGRYAVSPTTTSTGGK
jgi:Tfp pilus assembly protein PilN